MREINGYKIPNGVTKPEHVGGSNRCATFKYVKESGCTGMYCQECACQECPEELIEYLKKEESMEMPELEAGMVIKTESGCYLYVCGGKFLKSTAGSREDSGFLHTGIDMELVVSIHKWNGTGLGSISNIAGSLIWEKQDPTQKAIQDLKDQQARSNDEFSKKIAELEDTLN